MVWIPPPQLATPTRTSYAEAYQKVLAAHRRSPINSASSVVMLVAVDVDALCAARMLADLFKQDDVPYSIIPVADRDELAFQAHELAHYPLLHTIFLINMGAPVSLASEEFFEDCPPNVTINVIDSRRPISVENLFWGSEIAQRIVIWDDGDAENLRELGKAYETMLYAGELEEGSGDELSEDEGAEEDDSEDEEESEDENGERRKRRSSSTPDKRRSGKRRRVDKNPSSTVSIEDRHHYSSIVSHYFKLGISYGQSAAGTVYILATVLERADNEFLWLAILGLTYQYTTARISREYYERYQAIYHDEVSRLNPLPASETNGHTISTINPDDLNVRTCDELRFPLFRHWTLYDAMFHSSYVASKLGIWKERGRKRLTGFLAKMGFSILQTQQPYHHMDMDLKKRLRTQLDAIAPEYGLVELSYQSFLRSYGYRTQPLSAGDAVEGVSALLDAATGVRIDVEVEGARNGGEWFSGSRAWEAASARQGGDSGQGKKEQEEGQEKEDEAEADGAASDQWWVRNFWAAYDSLSDISALRDALPLAMAIHRAVVRQGTSIIDKQDIKSTRTYRVVTLQQGPDLALFCHPGMLARLGLWLIDALRDKLPGLNMRSKKKSLPLVLACLDERTGKYCVAGMMGALEYGDVRKNDFVHAFIEATTEFSTEVYRFSTHNPTVLEISQGELTTLLETLCDLQMRA
ncbi:hypothetical protein HGRIS_013534 [Hohenbuehelia grisea]|uniref:Cell division control protein 45 n=1 Tax=Hohenbuehelia grisea TaxID=104357 RepID=A0ABR3IVU8_9AGAR